jgi:hypothetical protein
MITLKEFSERDDVKVIISKYLLNDCWYLQTKRKFILFGRKIYTLMISENLANRIGIWE